MRMIGSPVPATMYLIFTPLESKNWSLASAMQGSRKSKLVTATRFLDFTCAHPLLSDHSYFGRVTAARHGCRSFKFPFIFPGKLHLIRRQLTLRAFSLEREDLPLELRVDHIRTALACDLWTASIVYNLVENRGSAQLAVVILYRQRNHRDIPHFPLPRACNRRIRRSDGRSCHQRDYQRHFCQLSHVSSFRYCCSCCSTSLRPPSLPRSPPASGKTVWLMERRVFVPVSRRPERTFQSEPLQFEVQPGLYRPISCRIGWTARSHRRWC